MKNPITAFIEWFRTLSAAHREYLSHMYFVLTTQNTQELVMDPRNAISKFEFWVTKRDFAVRVIARMVVVRSIIDFLFLNRGLLSRKIPGSMNVVDIAEKQWQAGAASWQQLRSEQLSDRYINSWLKSELAAFQDGVSSD